jgi:hypothetical protein
MEVLLDEPQKLAFDASELATPIETKHPGHPKISS